MKLRALIFPLMVAAGLFAADAPVLPNQFAGWQVSGAVKTSTDASVADPTNSQLLKEYGFTDLSTATYTRQGGKLTVKAARFTDTSGAYGAFTYYRRPPMLTEEIGDRGTSLNERILFHRGNILVDAIFDHVTAMSAAQLRELANSLPRPTGSNGNLPPILNYQPDHASQKDSKKYVVGPVGLSSIGSPLPSDLVDFNAGAEATLGKYDTAGGLATLLLIYYPTPQIAIEHLKRIEASRQQADSTLAKIGPFFDRRTGPILVVATGQLSQSEGNALVGSVNYEADVTWNENTYNDKKNNIGNIVVTALALCGVLICFALVIGVAFGGVRILLRKAFPDTVLAGGREVEFISLHLEEDGAKPVASESK
ncbi:MAG TPA: DUF6599 family protein [Terriglobales bacterium]|nr:DUF6599 family protein [Terriglobales bacterium]